jgi:hypothetical protein
MIEVSKLEAVLDVLLGVFLEGVLLEVLVLLEILGVSR